MEDEIYISRNEAIKQIQRFGVGSLDFEEGYTPEMAERFVIKLLRELPSEKSPTWVSVKDRLPDFEGAVLCLRKSYAHKDVKYQDILYFDSDEQRFQEMWAEFFVEDGDITHWMPLPQPPKEND